MVDRCKHDLEKLFCGLCNPTPKPVKVLTDDGIWRAEADERYHSQSNRRHSHSRWEPWEDELVLESKHDPTLSKKIGRSIRAIQMRRLKLKESRRKPLTYAH